MTHGCMPPQTRLSRCGKGQVALTLVLSGSLPSFELAVAIQQTQCQQFEHTEDRSWQNQDNCVVSTVEQVYRK